MSKDKLTAIDEIHTLTSRFTRKEPYITNVLVRVLFVLQDMDVVQNPEAAKIHQALKDCIGTVYRPEDEETT